MTEDEARGWIASRFDASALALLTSFAGMVVEESTRQNLIAASTLDHLWARHIVDSAQLVPLASTACAGMWLDIGTGAGFPGMVTAILSDRPTVLAEPRRRRADFLTIAAGKLGLSSRVTIIPEKVERVTLTAAVISARAVAQVDAILGSALQCTTLDTLWLLPKGKSAREEVAQARRSWHGMFHVEQSVTDPESLVVIANKVSRR